MRFLQLLFVFYVSVNAAPVKETESKDGTESGTTRENKVVGEAKAGIIDTLNPFSNNSPAPDKNKANEESSNPLSGIQSLFNASNNPFAQLFSSSSDGSNFLNDVKIFMVGSQGMIMPASAFLGGLQSFMQAIGNMGNLLQGAQNLIPSIPGS